MVTVRQASVDDLPVLCEMGRVMRAESIVDFPEPVEDEWREMIGILGSGYFMAVAEHERIPAGFITALQGRYIFSAKPVVTVDTFYVRPENRGGRTAVLLIRAVEGWRKSLGVGRLILGIHTGLAPGVTGRFYEKLGYAHMGGNYVRDF